MKSFNGFISNRDQNTSIPHEFFSEILPNINNLYELKTILYILWFIENNDLEYPIITIEQLKNDELYLSGLGSHKTDQLKHLNESIKQGVDDGILIDSKIHNNKGSEAIIIENSEYSF